MASFMLTLSTDFETQNAPGGGLGGPDVLHGRVLAALLSPCRAPGRRLRRPQCPRPAPLLPPRQLPPRRPAFQQPRPRWAPGSSPFCQTPQVPKGAHALGQRPPLPPPLRVTGPLRAMKCPSSEPVSTMVPTPLFSVILERMSSPRLPRLCWRWPAGLDLVPSCGRTQRPAGDKAWAQHVVHAEGLGGRGGRRSRVVRGIGNCWRSSQNEPVAVVGYAQAVRSLAIGGSGKVGANPGGQPCASVRALGQQRPVQRAQRGVNRVEVAAPVRREETVGQADLVDGKPSVALQVQGSPNLPQSRCPSRPLSRGCPRRS